MIAMLSSGLANIEVIVCDDCNNAAVFSDEAITRGFVQSDDGDWFCESCLEQQARDLVHAYDRAYFG